MANGLKALVLAMAALVASCAGPQSVKDAHKDVDHFHQQLDAQQLDAIWNATSQDLRVASSRQDFDGLLTRIHENLGDVVTTKQVGWATNVSTNGSFVTLTMQTQFQRGSGREEFVFRNTSGKYSLAGYHINVGPGGPGGEAQPATPPKAGNKT